MNKKQLDSRKRQMEWKMKHHKYHNTTDYQNKLKAEYNEETDDPRKRIA